MSKLNATVVICHSVLGELKLTKLELCNEIEAFFRCFPETIYEEKPNYETLRSMTLFSLVKLYKQCLDLGLHH